MLDSTTVVSALPVEMRLRTQLGSCCASLNTVLPRLAGGEALISIRGARAPEAAIVQAPPRQERTRGRTPFLVRTCAETEMSHNMMTCESSDLVMHGRPFQYTLVAHYACVYVSFL